MGNIIGQRWEVYDYVKVKELTPQKGEMAVITRTPDFGERIIQMVADGVKTVELLYEEWKASQNKAVIPTDGWEQLKITAQSNIIGTMQDEPWFIRLHRRAKLIHVYFPGIVKQSLERNPKWDNLLVQALMPDGVNLFPYAGTNWDGDSERIYMNAFGQSAVSQSGVPGTEDRMYPTPIRYSQKRGSYYDPETDTEIEEKKLFTVAMRIPEEAFSNANINPNWPNTKLFHANIFIPVEIEETV